MQGKKQTPNTHSVIGLVLNADSSSARIIPLELFRSRNTNGGDCVNMVDIIQ